MRILPTVALLSLGSSAARADVVYVTSDASVAKNKVYVTPRASEEKR
jgi:hypothetical protein